MKAGFSGSSRAQQAVEFGGRFDIGDMRAGQHGQRGAGQVLRQPLRIGHGGDGIVFGADYLHIDIGLMHQRAHIANIEATAEFNRLLRPA